MSFLLTAGGALLVLFLLAFLRAGRFGTTILAFGVGYLLATIWTDALASYGNFSMPGVSSKDITYAMLVVTPGILALIFSPKQKSLLPGLLQAFAVAVLGVALLAPILGVGGGQISEFYTLIEQNRDILVTVLLLLGLLDMVFSRSEKAPKHKEH